MLLKTLVWLKGRSRFQPGEGKFLQHPGGGLLGSQMLISNTSLPGPPHVFAGGWGHDSLSSGGRESLLVEKMWWTEQSGMYLLSGHACVINFFSYTFYYNISATTSNFLTSLLFPVNCPYLDL